MTIGEYLSNKLLVASPSAQIHILWKGSGDRASPACHSFEFETKHLHFSSLIGFQPCDLVIPPGCVTWAIKK
jgi:hypothetical protein